MCENYTVMPPRQNCATYNSSVRTRGHATPFMTRTNGPSFTEPVLIKKISELRSPAQFSFKQLRRLYRSAIQKFPLLFVISLQVLVPAHTALHPLACLPLAVIFNTAPCGTRLPAAEVPPLFTRILPHAQQSGHHLSLQTVKRLHVMRCGSPSTESSKRNRLYSASKQRKLTSHSKFDPTRLAQVSIKHAPQFRNQERPLVRKPNIMLNGPS